MPQDTHHVKLYKQFLHAELTKQYFAEAYKNNNTVQDLFSQGKTLEAKAEIRRLKTEASAKAALHPKVIPK